MLYIELHQNPVHVQKENKMNYRIMFALNSVVALLFGLGFLFFPARALGLLGTETFVSTILISRLFGTVLLGLGLALWFAKDVNDLSVQKGMGIALLVSAATGLVVTLLGTFASHAVIRSNGWVVMLIYLAFGLGYGYLLFLKRESSFRPA
jgi:hypothetical protein